MKIIARISFTAAAIALGLSVFSGVALAAPTSIPEVLKTLEGLDGQARTAKLVEMAKAEGGLSIYTSNPAVKDITPRIEKLFGIKIEIVQGTAEEVSARVFQEHQAHRNRADIIEALNPNDRAFMMKNNMFAKYSGPILKTLPKQAIIDDYFIAQRWTVSTVGWNTKLVPKEDWPKTIEDVVKFKGSVMIESRQPGWLMAVTDYYKTKGWTEDRVQDMLREIATGSLITTGHALTTELLVAGEAKIALDTYHSYLETRSKQGAPVEWKPPVIPMTIRPNGALLMAEAPHPASAVLYLEYMLENVGIWSEFDQLPVTALNSPPFVSMPAGTIVVEDPDRIVSEADKWNARMADLVGRGKKKQ